MSIIVKCKYCESAFRTALYNIVRGRGVYCSVKCMGKSYRKERVVFKGYIFL